MAKRIGSMFRVGHEMAENKKHTRGGARPGAGRPPRITIQKMVRLTPAEVEAVKLAAQHDGITPHAWMVRVIQAALRMPSPPD